jgi:hypothetical protein
MTFSAQRTIQKDRRGRLAVTAAKLAAATQAAKLRPRPSSRRIPRHFDMAETATLAMRR